VNRTVHIVVLGFIFAAAARADDSVPLAADCKADTRVNPGYTRVHVGLRNGIDGSGKSASDARDGSTPEKLDRVLRCYLLGCADPHAPGRTVQKTENLVVCLGPGTFRTKGTYGFVVNVPAKTEDGFALGKGWKIHGSGKDKTTVQLSEYLPITAEPNPQGLPARTGAGVVFSTFSDDASEIEISDLTVDDNYSALKQRANEEGIRVLNLQAIHLRSDRGGNWIHDINVVNTSGEIGSLDIKYEAFPVWIYSVRLNSSPTDNSGNIIERVSMSSYGGGKCTAIAMANAVGEVRNNRVEGYQIGYGGWTMGQVSFHDNVAVETEYGFNIDSLVNKSVVIERNQIVHPRSYGIVIGGSGTYDSFQVRGNTVQINRPGVIALVLQGNVNNALIADNSFLAEPLPMRATAIRSLSNGRAAGPNRNNSYLGNKISEKLKITFSDHLRKEESCVTNNRDEQGHSLRDLPDNRSPICASSAPVGR
jgi:hypothetical protein